MTDRHIAQLNIARLSYDPDDTRVRDFMNALDLVNGLAERSPGFVWRLKDESGNATNIQFGGDDRIIVNMSVWESPQALEEFVWNTIHKKFYRRRGEWFEPPAEPNLVMWWVARGHQPDIAEARARLEHYRRHGSSDHAFGWEHLPHITAWRQAQCAAAE